MKDLIGLGGCWPTPNRKGQSADHIIARRINTRNEPVK
jgi:hypothetical protein